MDEYNINMEKHEPERERKKQEIKERYKRKDFKNFIITMTAIFGPGFLGIGYISYTDPKNPYEDTQAVKEYRVMSETLNALKNEKE